MMVRNLFLEIQLAWYNLLKKDLGIFTVQVVLGLKSMHFCCFFYNTAKHYHFIRFITLEIDHLQMCVIGLDLYYVNRSLLFLGHF